MIRITVGLKGGSKGTAMGIVIICCLHQTPKSRSTIRAGHVARMGKIGVAYIISVGKVTGSYHLGENGIKLIPKDFTTFKTAHWLDPNFPTKMLYSVVQTPALSLLPTV